MYLLDTNVISELRKAKPHGGVLSWYERTPIEVVALSIIVLYELQAGVERTRLQDIPKAEALEQWIGRLPKRIAVLPFGTQEARLTARFLRKKSLDLFPDAMIAATAAAYNLTVITRNTSDFANFPVQIYNPFNPER